MDAMAENELMTVAEAAAFLRRSRAAMDIYRHRRTGPPYCKIQGKILYRRSALLQYLQECTIDPENDLAPAKPKKSPAKSGKSPAKTAQSPAKSAPRPAPDADKDDVPDFSQMKRGAPSKRKPKD